MQTITKRIKEFLDRDVKLGLTDKKSAERLNWYIDTYFTTDETQFPKPEDVRIRATEYMLNDIDAGDTRSAILAKISFIAGAKWMRENSDPTVLKQETK